MVTSRTAGFSARKSGSSGAIRDLLRGVVHRRELALNGKVAVLRGRPQRGIESLPVRRGHITVVLSNEAGKDAELDCLIAQVVVVHVGEVRVRGSELVSTTGQLRKTFLLVALGLLGGDLLGLLLVGGQRGAIRCRGRFKVAEVRDEIGGQLCQSPQGLLGGEGSRPWGGLGGGDQGPRRDGSARGSGCLGGERVGGRLGLGVLTSLGVLAWHRRGRCQAGPAATHGGTIRDSTVDRGSLLRGETVRPAVQRGEVVAVHDEPVTERDQVRGGIRDGLGGGGGSGGLGDRLLLGQLTSLTSLTSPTSLTLHLHLHGEVDNGRLDGLRVEPRVHRGHGRVNLGGGSLILSLRLGLRLLGGVHVHLSNGPTNLVG